MMYQPVQQPRPSTDPSDPFVASPQHSQRTTPNSLKRPASLIIPPAPYFGTARQGEDAYNGTIKRKEKRILGPPSPAPFVGFAQPPTDADNWPSRVQQGAFDPFGPFPSPFAGFSQPSYAGISAADATMAASDDEQHPSSDDMIIDLLSPHRQSFNVGSSPMRPPPSPGAEPPRLSPFPRESKRPSLSRQLFGKSTGSSEVARDLSPSGFPFPLTPPLTPPYTLGSLDGKAVAVASTSTLPPTPPTTVPRPSPQPVEAHFPQDAEPTVSSRLLAKHDLHPRFAQHYTILGELGAGGFGFVVRAIRNADKRIVAVKFIFRNKVPSHGWVKCSGWDGGALAGKMDQERMIPMEAYVLRLCRHEGIVGFIDLLETDEYFYLVMEHHGSPWAAGGDKDKSNNTSPMSLPALAAAAKSASYASGSAVASSSPATSPTGSPTSSHLLVPPSAGARFEIGQGPSQSAGGVTQRPGMPLRRSSCDLFECIEQHTRLPEDQARHIFAQIVDVVCYLQSRGVCHRDIKDENIVIDKQFRVKLIDFGSAVTFDASKPAPFYNKFWGTMNFASAEILAGKPYQAPPAEVWALGVLLHILLCGEAPFSDPSRAMQGRISHTPNRPTLSRQCQDLLVQCLRPDPAERITIQQIRAHPWLRSVLRGSDMARSTSTFA